MRRRTAETIYRNAEAGNRIISELNAIKPDGKYGFIQKDVSILKNVDEVCNEIKSNEDKFNLIFMTQGTLSLKGRNGTSPFGSEGCSLILTSLLLETLEGLDKKLSAHYYSRVRFAQQLLPQLKAASGQLSRVVSIFSAGSESSSIDFNDLGLKQSFSLAKAANHAIDMTDFAFEELAKQNPSVSFVHRFPGLVNTGLFKDQGVLARAGGSVLTTLLTPWMTSVKDCAEKSLFVATSNRFPPQDGSKGGVGAGDMDVSKGSTGKPGSGAYLVGANADYNPKEKILEKLREQQAGSKIWEHTMEEFARIDAL